MPHTLAALECGALSEWRAGLIVREAADLSAQDRRALDAELCADASKLDGMGNARIAGAAQQIAQRLDDRAASERAAKAAADRRVAIRPAPDAMSYVTALLPAAQGVSVYAALTRAAAAADDHRSRGAVMADTLVERVTGRPVRVPEPVAVNLVLSDETLLGGDTSPAVIEGYGPIPASVARHPDQRCGHRRELPRHRATALSPSGHRGAGGHGIAIAALPPRSSEVHPAARPELSHPLL
jgi:hypothetical protein